MRLRDNSIVTILIKFKFLSLVLYLLSTFLTVSYDTEEKKSATFEDKIRYFHLYSRMQGLATMRLAQVAIEKK